MYVLAWRGSHHIAVFRIPINTNWTLCKAPSAKHLWGQTYGTAIFGLPGKPPHRTPIYQIRVASVRLDLVWLFGPNGLAFAKLEACPGSEVE